MAQQAARPRRHAGDWQPRVVGVSPENINPTWFDAVDAFLRRCRARNCSRSTLETYEHFLLGPRAQQFLTDYRIEHIADVTIDKLRDFQAELLDAGLRPATAGTFHQIFRNFLRFCDREGWAVPLPALRAEAPRQPVFEPEVFTAAEERKILASARTDRDRFIIEFLLRTGVRRAELLEITLDDIVEGTGGTYLRVRQGKGRKDRIIPLDTAAVKFSRHVARFIRDVRPRDAQSRYLFLSSRRDPKTGDYRPLDKEGLKSLMRRLGDDTGIHVHPHKFRHTFATRCLQAGVDSLMLQRALGHTTLAMVNRYVHFQSDDLLQAWAARKD